VTASITKASFYRLVWHTINVINNCTSLDIKLPTIAQLPAIREGFKSISRDGIMDADCRFIFLCLAAPGKTNDTVTIHKTSLPAWLVALPPGYFTAADCAYSITEHLVASYSGPQRYIEAYHNFNFYLSQLCIRIEMAFGLLVTKWRILHTPINVKLKNLKKLLGAICRLHNFCIDNR
jgi:hypothetical protein